MDTLNEFIPLWLGFSALITFSLWLFGLIAILMANACGTEEDKDDGRAFLRYGLLSWLWPVALPAGLVVGFVVILAYIFGLDKVWAKRKRLRAEEKSARLTA